ncbi:MAG TPA: hypothetical protein PK096_04860 [Candidatus Saccharibacteria bacterium]|nr:hypothetical protein [Candidatus Saccharibacteria bacterium]HRK94665.1 hypothetical protein [Candidatus Saccharibacteria bacterium]
MSEPTPNDYIRDMSDDMAPGMYSHDGTGFYVPKEFADSVRENVEPNKARRVLQDYVVTMSRAEGESYDDYRQTLDKKASEGSSTDDEVRNYAKLFRLGEKVGRGEGLDEDDLQYLAAIESYRDAMSKSMSIEGEDHGMIAEILDNLSDTGKIELLIQDCVKAFNAADTEAEQAQIETMLSELEDYKYLLENSTYPRIEPHQPNPDNTDPELVMVNLYFAKYYPHLVAKAKTLQQAA